MKSQKPDKGKEKITINSYTNGKIHQFWFEDGVLHMWVNERSGLYTIPLNEKQELHFLADVYHKPREGTVYELKGIYEI